MCIAQEAQRDTLCQSCVFSFGGICGSRSAFWCVRVVKYRRTIFHARVGTVWIPQKARMGPVTPKLCFSIHWDLWVT
jgi:hypothetical protein